LLYTPLWDPQELPQLHPGFRSLMGALRSLYPSPTRVNNLRPSAESSLS
jgi:hypothetical protein